MEQGTVKKDFTAYKNKQAENQSRMFAMGNEQSVKCFGQFTACKKLK